jgi:hypothetical protein
VIRVATEADSQLVQELWHAFNVEIPDAPWRDPDEDDFAPDVSFLAGSDGLASLRREGSRVFVLDVGPNIDSSFHVVGTIFDSVTKEGVSLTKGNAGGWGSQAVDLSPAQGAIIEFSPQEDGMYPMVTHAFNFVGRGALGLFMAGDGDPTN